MKFRSSVLADILIPALLVSASGWAFADEKPREETWITGGAVFGIATTPAAICSGGNLHCVGHYTSAGSPISIAKARLAIGSPKINGIVFSACSDEVGGGLVGGFFMDIDNVSCQNPIYSLAGGVLDTAGPNGTNNILRVTNSAPGGMLCIGGAFTQVDGVPRTGLAEFVLSTNTPFPPASGRSIETEHEARLL